MSQKCQSIYIGLGPTGCRVARQFLEDYGVANQPDTRIPFGMEIIWYDPAGGEDVPHDAGLLTSRSEESLIHQVRHAMEHLLGHRPVTDFGFSYTLDVFVCGAWADEDFRRELPMVLCLLERLGHDLYRSIFCPWDDLCNARLLVHPFSVSVNMPHEACRDEVLALLARLQTWHEEMLAQGRAVVPGFFICDGFTHNIQLQHDEVVDITANFIGLCVTGQVRWDPAFRHLMSFASRPGSDIFNVLSLATLFFPRQRLRRAAERAILRKMHQALTARPAKGRSAELAKDLEPLFSAAGTADIKQSLVGWVLLPPQETLFSHAIKRHMDTLPNGKPTFPEHPESQDPEVLERHFDAAWVRHLVESCQPRGSKGVARTFAEHSDGLRECGVKAQGLLFDELGSILLRMAGPTRAYFSLHALGAAIDHSRTHQIPGFHRKIRDRVDRLPDTQWHFEGLRDIWARMRAVLWEHVPAHAVFLWAPLFASALGMTLLALWHQHVATLTGEGVNEPALQAVDTWPFLPELCMLLCAAGGMAGLGVVAWWKSRRLKRFLSTEKHGRKTEVLVLATEHGEVAVPADQYAGVLPSAASRMADLGGAWWSSHEELGRLAQMESLSRQLDRHLELKKEQVNLVLRCLDLREKEMLVEEEHDEAVGGRHYYFHDDLLYQRELNGLTEMLNRHYSTTLAARTVLERLHAQGLAALLEGVADLPLLRREMAQELPFFAEGGPFAETVLHERLAERVQIFLKHLPDRLAHGQIFHFLASEEEDKHIETTAILLFAPQEARDLFQQLGEASGLRLELVTTSNRDNVWALQMIRDLSLHSVFRYMKPGLNQEELEELMAGLCCLNGEPEPLAQARPQDVWTPVGTEA